LKLVSGTYRPDRSNPAEPMPKAGIPEMPANLSRAGKVAWNRYVTLLTELGILTVSDGPALQCLSEATADLAAARQALRERGSLTYATTTRSAGLMHRPWPEVALVAESDHRLMIWLAKFGLSPVDRARVSIVGKDYPDPNARFFR
jgi:P27 family predicted phage terminase small subunit